MALNWYGTRQADIYLFGYVQRIKIDLSSSFIRFQLANQRLQDGKSFCLTLVVCWATQCLQYK